MSLENLVSKKSITVIKRNQAQNILFRIYIFLFYYKIFKSRFVGNQHILTTNKFKIELHM